MPDSKNFDETPLIDLLTALLAITARQIIRENIIDILNSRSPSNDIKEIEVYVK